MQANDPIATIRAFIAAWNRRDRAALARMLHPDAVCEGVCLPPPGRNREESLNLFDPFLAADELDWRILNIAASGRSVFTERLDRFRYKDMPWTEIRACGYFELDDQGRITAWRDYFDRAECLAAMPAAS
ncbi:MAG: nuclear transport factor 2 family protein [Novosphingobium sp.]|nr:nuclear transport factor 2 family protein [Novosphingobium sp.]